MSRPPLESIRTAVELFEKRPDVTVFRYMGGNFDVDPTQHSAEPFVGFRTLVLMSRLFRRPFGSALCIASEIPGQNNGQRTRLLIPPTETLDLSRHVIQEGEHSPEDVAEMARDGVWLLSAYQGLSRDERLNFTIADGMSIVHDTMTGTEPDISSGRVPAELIPNTALAVARRVLEVV